MDQESHKIYNISSDLSTRQIEKRTQIKVDIKAVSYSSGIFSVSNHR